MIICRSKGFIFLRVPKTASTSLSVHIQKNIQFADNDAFFQLDRIGQRPLPAKNIYYPDSGNQHPNLQFAINRKIVKQNEVESMNVYGVLREPYSRTISLFGNIVGIYKSRFNNFLHQKNATLNFTAEYNSLTTNQIVETALNLMMQSKDPFKFVLNIDAYLPLDPQSNWLVHNNKNINNIITYPNFEKFLPKIGLNLDFNERETIAAPHVKTELHDDLKQQIRNLYQDDFRLWEQVNSTLP